MAKGGLGWYFLFLLSRGGHATAERNWKFQETSLTYLFLYYCTANLICDRHVISILAPRCVLLVHVFCSNSIRYGEMSKRHLVEGCDRWNSIFTSISFAISTWMSKEMSCKNFRKQTSTSLSRRLFVIWFEGHSLAFSLNGSLVHDEISAKKKIIKGHLVKSSDRRNNIFTSISSEISRWILKKILVL